MSQEYNSQSSINTAGLKQTPSKKYRKFDANFKKQISIERSHGIFDKDQRDENSSKIGQSNQGITVQPFKIVSKIRSESSLSGVKGSRKIPLTPRKQKGGIERKSRSHTIKQAMIKIRLALKDFEKLHIQIENIIKSTLQDFIREMQQSIRQFVDNQLSYIIEQKKLHYKVMLQSSSQQKNYEVQQAPSKQFNQINEANILQSPIKNSNVRIVQGQSHHKNNIFSSTIHLRQRLRQNATNPVLKTPKTAIKQPNQSLIAKADLVVRSQLMSPTTRNASRSIEKLQTHLSSLKKLLSQQ